ncbi:DUF5672 family protein [Pedobacter chinensis]|nr:DUF5672 family protein [Pedobacter chinensis]
MLKNKFIREKKAQYKIFKDHFFSSLGGYNKLMKFPGFYGAFLDFKFMLIYQLDAFVFRDELDYWCNQNFDYIGAPFIKESGNEAGGIIIGQGNGGFSLRRIASFYKIGRQIKKLQFKHPFFSPSKPFYINLWRDIKYNMIYNFSFYPLQPVVNEDIFWAQLIPSAFADFRVPEPMQTLPFSFEVSPGALYILNEYKLPFGCHGWWKYEPDFWARYIREVGYEI